MGDSWRLENVKVHSSKWKIQELRMNSMNHCLWAIEDFIIENGRYQLTQISKMIQTLSNFSSIYRTVKLWLLTGRLDTVNGIGVEVHWKSKWDCERKSRDFYTNKDSSHS